MTLEDRVADLARKSKVLGIFVALITLVSSVELVLLLKLHWHQQDAVILKDEQGNIRAQGLLGLPEVSYPPGAKKPVFIVLDDGIIGQRSELSAQSVSFDSVTGTSVSLSNKGLSFWDREGIRTLTAAGWCFYDHSGRLIRQVLWESQPAENK